MIQEQMSYDFSSFNSVEEKEIFVKNLIKKQVELSQIFCLIYPSNQILCIHVELMICLYNSDFYKILFDRLNTAVSAVELAEILCKVLDKQFQN